MRPHLELLIDYQFNLPTIAPGGGIEFDENVEIEQFFGSAAVREILGSMQGQLSLMLDSQPVDVHFVHEDDKIRIWLVDRSELVYLQEALKKVKSPDRKALRNLDNLLTSIRGQSELLSVMLEHEESFSIDQLKVLRGCQAEISAKLAQSEHLLSALRGQKVQPLVRAVGSDPAQQRAMVFHRDDTVGELIAEVFRLEGIQVEAFSDETAARR